MTGKVLTLRRADTCASCGLDLAAGDRAEWEAASRSTTCLTCVSASSTAEVETAVADSGVGGASAQREFDRRHEARRERVMSNHPKIGRLLLAVVDDAPSTKVWAQGAAGERAIADRLDAIENGLVLHDRRLRQPDGRLSRANIDHIAIVPSGVWVIDAKTHKGRLEVRRTGGLFTPRTEQLRIDGRDQSKLVEGLHKQVNAVRAALGEGPAVPNVAGALCFVGTGLPWLDEEVDGIPLRGRQGLVKILGRPGPLKIDAIAGLHRRLSELFPPA